MAQSSALGRGLSSLIPNRKNLTSSTGFGYNEAASSEAISGAGERIVLLPVGKVSPNPHQPRQNFDQSELKDLIDSIKEHGIIQPLIVVKDSNGWQLIAGERRWRAAKSLGLGEVPAIVRDWDEQKKMEIALIENLQRKDLNALEVAVAYQTLIDQFNLTQEDLSKRVGKSRSSVANTLRLLSVHDKVKEAIISGQITEGHARTLVGLPVEDQLRLLEKIINNKLNVREAERQGKDVVVQKHIRKVRYNPDLRAKEGQLESSLGTKVEIKGSSGSGQIIIKYFSEEELNSIVSKII